MLGLQRHLTSDAVLDVPLLKMMLQMLLNLLDFLTSVAKLSHQFFAALAWKSHACHHSSLPCSLAQPSRILLQVLSLGLTCPSSFIS
jgi:hypothetical protein